MVGVPWALGTMAVAGSNFRDKTGFLLVPGIGPWLMLLAGGAKDAFCTTADAGTTAGSTDCSGRSAGRAVPALEGRPSP